MADKLKLGVVGFGRIVELVHLPLLKKLPEFEVSGVFDITPERLQLAEKRGFRAYADVEELLASEVDAVLIATPPNSHRDLAVKAMRLGKHVLIEKPVTLDGTEAADLLVVAEETNRVVTVFQNRRFDADYRLVQQVLAEGTLGNLQFVERRYHMFGTGANFGVKSFNPNWRNERGFGGGALLDWGVHLVDQLLQLNLGEVADVRAVVHTHPWQQGNVEDYVHASLFLQNGVLLSLEANFASNANVPLWVVGGDEATLQVMSEKEAYLLAKGKKPQVIEIDAALKSNPAEVYRTFAQQIHTGQGLAVTLPQVVETMQVLDQIRAAAIGKQTDKSII